jgi:hypothetical protein
MFRKTKCLTFNNDVRISVLVHTHDTVCPPPLQHGVVALKHGAPLDRFDQREGTLAGEEAVEEEVEEAVEEEDGAEDGEEDGEEEEGVLAHSTQHTTHPD